MTTSQFARVERDREVLRLGDAHPDAPPDQALVRRIAVGVDAKMGSGVTQRGSTFGAAWQRIAARSWIGSRSLPRRELFEELIQHGAAKSTSFAMWEAVLDRPVPTRYPAEGGADDRVEHAPVTRRQPRPVRR
jgi:hypothetical protein